MAVDWRHTPLLFPFFVQHAGSGVFVVAPPSPAGAVPPPEHSPKTPIGSHIPVVLLLSSGFVQGAHTCPAEQTSCLRIDFARGSASIFGMSAIVMHPPPTTDVHVFSGLPAAARTSSGTQTMLASGHGP